MIDATSESLLRQAIEQANIDGTLDSLREKVDKSDSHIQKLQKLALMMSFLQDK